MAPLGQKYPTPARAAVWVIGRPPPLAQASRCRRSAARWAAARRWRSSDQPQAQLLHERRQRRRDDDIVVDMAELDLHGGRAVPDAGGVPASLAQPVVAEFRRSDRPGARGERRGRRSASRWRYRARAPHRGRSAGCRTTPARKAATRPPWSVINGFDITSSSTARMLVMVSTARVAPQRHGLSPLPIETWPNWPAP